MALLEAQGIAGLASALLTRTLTLVQTVARIPGNDFSGPNGSTITLRVRQPVLAREQVTPGATITFDDMLETSVNVTLAHLYRATHVTDEDLSHTLEDFGAQVLQPLVAGVATGAEDELAQAMNGLTADPAIEFPLIPDPAADEAVILAARQQLSEADVPAGQRWMALSPDIATRLLTIDKFVRVDQSGSPSALRDAMLGQLYGFGFVESNALTAGTAVAYHQSGFVFGNRTPVPPSSVDSATSTESGVGLRVIRAFDTSVLSEAVAVSTFAGAAAVSEDDDGTEIVRAIRIGTSAT